MYNSLIRACRKPGAPDEGNKENGGTTAINEALDGLLGGANPSIFLATIYCNATHDHANDPAAYIGRILQLFTLLDQRVSHQTQRVYQQEGCSVRWKELDAAHQPVRLVVSLLEDLMCTAMLGVSELQNAWSHGALMYLKL